MSAARSSVPFVTSQNTADLNDSAPSCSTSSTFSACFFSGQAGAQRTELRQRGPGAAVALQRAARLRA